MKPVLIVQHDEAAGPAYFAEVLGLHGLGVEFCCVFANDPIPGGVSPYAGICSLGGLASANDDMPWVAEETALLGEADARGVPVIGHCLGGQMLSRALGGVVERAPCEEVGWYEITALPAAQTSTLLRGIDTPTSVLLWHGDVFENPPGTIPLFHGSDAFPNQGFATRNGSLAIQSHIELDADTLTVWVDHAGDKLDATRSSIQSAGELLDDLGSKIAGSQRFARRIYENWIAGLAR